MDKRRILKPLPHFFMGILQHACAVAVVVCMLIVYFNSRVGMASTWMGSNGSYSREYYSYSIDGYNAGAFEDSDAFNEMLLNSTEEIFRLVVIKSQLETNGQFDGSKLIDVTAYVNRKVGKSTESITALYSLEDLLKWYKYGVETETVTFYDEEELLTYFGNTNEYENVQIDLYSSDSSEVVTYTTADNGAGNQKKLNQGNVTFEGLLRQFDEAGIAYEVSYNEYGNMEVAEVSLLKERYLSYGGYSLGELAGSWSTYCTLMKNTITAMESLSYNYEAYQSLWSRYSTGNSNVFFYLELEQNGKKEVYTNETTPVETSALDEKYKGLGRYIIYHPSNMEYESNTQLVEDEIFQAMCQYEYTLTENSEIWIGVDTTYSNQSGIFYQAFEKHENMRWVWQLIVAAVAAALAWVILLLYRSIKTGRSLDEGGKIVSSINGFDRIPTELALIMSVGIAYLLLWTIDIFMNYCSGTYLDITNTDIQLRLYLVGGAITFVSSTCLCLFFYSLIRRCKSQSLWRDSICRQIFCFVGRGLGHILKGIASIFEHGSISVRTIIPYLVFMIINGVGVILLFALLFQGILSLLIIGFLILLSFDIAVCVLIYKHSLYRAKIIEDITKIRDGEMNHKVDCSKLYGDNKLLGEAVNSIGDGISKAVAASMRDEKLKAELITNVSHDIKTPLTSIINYVDLLKREHIEEQPVKGYIEVLDAKAMRLKQLTDDLVEASKISSGNITLNMEKINLTELVNQAIGEFTEKFEEKSLNVVASFNRPYLINADSRHIWRVVENLFNNIYKYAMPGTRVYVDMRESLGQKESLVEMSFKNISEQLLNICADELTERFIRGDVSRSTEGSGLGLSIAKNLTTAMNGEFDIYLDGDLFKVVLRFKLLENVEDVIG